MNALTALLFDYTFQTVALGSAVLGLMSGVMGTYAVLRKQSLLGDGVSHAALPGVVLAFLALGTKQTEFLLLGALLAGLSATLLILAVTRLTRIKFDGALALVMSSFFGAGMVLLTYAQRLPNANQAGLSRFIFGQATTMLARDVYMMVALCVVILILVAAFWKEFQIFSFDPEYTAAIGFSNRRLSLLMAFMTVLAIIAGLQTVGVILMSALLIAPAAAARQWTDRLHVMVALSALFGALSGILGTAVSALTPKLPTGPAIVLFASLITVISLLFAPGRGVLHRAWQRHKMRTAYLPHHGGDNDVPTA